MIFEAQIREPYMGNSMPVKAMIYLEKDGIKKVEIENPEGIRIGAKLESVFLVNKKAFETFHRETTGER